MVLPRRQDPPSQGGAGRARAEGRLTHWTQLTAFCVVGASGYVVNLFVFAFAFATMGLHHLAAAAVAFVVAMLNNFHWNRHWTFAGHEGSARTQMPRFVAVSLLAFSVATVLLAVLVDLDVSAVIAQAVAIAAVTPFSFAANRYWSFKPLPAELGARESRHGESGETAEAPASPGLLGDGESRT